MKIAIVALAAACAAELAASTPAIPLPVQNELRNPRLSGQGTFRWFGMEIYSAQLWVDEQGRQDFRNGAPATAKFALELHYARGLKGSRIAESSLDEMQKLEFGTPAQHQNWLAQMSRLFPDVQQGSRICGVFLPNAGARFYLNGKLLGEVADAEFGRAFFAIWLDPKTSAPALRNALLGRSAASQ